MRFGNKMAAFGLMFACASSVPVVVWAQPAADSPVPGARVARAQFTRAVVDREPVDELAVLDTRVQEVFFFTDLRGLEGRTVTHRWEYEGRVIADVPFAVKGPRWRVFSRKTLVPALVGKWTVLVVDESGWTLDAAVFQYVEAEPEPQPEPPLEPEP